ncbi:MAG: hypothetical protein ACHQ5A_13900 [Opitutales bacterium]
MAARSLRSVSSPFPVQVEVEFLDRLSEPVREGKAKSVSDLIRSALERYDLANLVVVRPAQLTISVRLPGELRRRLRLAARTQGTSVGQLVRAAVESYLSVLEGQAPGQMEMPIAAEPPVRPAPVQRSGRRSRKRRQAVSPRPAGRRPMTRKRSKG